MKRSRFSEEQVIGILKEHEAGVSVADLSTRDGRSRCAMPMAPRQRPSLHPPSRAKPPPETNSELDRNWGQRQGSRPPHSRARPPRFLAQAPAVEKLKEKIAESRAKDLTEKSPYKEL
jgi:hypothetical protein